MSLTEIKDQVAELTPDDRLEVAAWIMHLNRVDDPAYQAELSRRLDAMAAGRQTSQTQLERIHEELKAQGR